MAGRVDEIVQRVREKHLSGPVPRSRRSPAHAVGRTLRRHLWLVLGMTLAVALAATVGYILGIDYLTKRQSYPERNVLYRATQMVSVAGSTGDGSADQSNMLSDSLVYEGGGAGKVGTYLLRTVREQRKDIEYFNMDDTQKIRIASATRKSEIVQAGLRIGGSLNFKEQLAEIILGPGAKARRSYRVYKMVPERGRDEVEVTVLADDDGTLTAVNRMTERREWLLGWLWGKGFRDGTWLEAYLDHSDSRKRMSRFLETVRVLDSSETVDPGRREKAILEARRLSRAVPTRPVYFSYEDGFFDILPQESTVYLAHEPGWTERVADAVRGDSKAVRLRVENHWDLFPGRYPLLRRIHLGSGENVVYPFDKYNNGGYRIRDRYGEIARIEIQDFILHYGQDLVYHYYLDRSGDGRIDPDTERIGTVLCRTTHDERLNMEAVGGTDRPGADVTFTLHYSFMAPDDDPEAGIAAFRLCGYIETMMPDQVNRGFGTHSMLGYINQQRGDIMLYTDLRIENMSRVLTQESTLTADADIVRVLAAARRPYARQVARAYGLEDLLAESPPPSPDLTFRRDWSVLLCLAATLVSLVFVSVLAVRRRRNGR